MRPHLMCACVREYARMQTDRWINGCLDRRTHSRTHTNKHAHARAHTQSLTDMHTDMHTHKHTYMNTCSMQRSNPQNTDISLIHRDTDKPCQDAKHKIPNAVAAARPRRIWSLLSPRSRPRPRIAIAHQCASATGLRVRTGVRMYVTHAYIRQIDRQIDRHVYVQTCMLTYTYVYA